MIDSNALPLYVAGGEGDGAELQHTQARVPLDALSLHTHRVHYRGMRPGGWRIGILSDRSMKACGCGVSGHLPPIRPLCFFLCV